MNTIVLYCAVDVDTKRCMPDSPQKSCKEPTSKQAEEIDGAIDFIGVCDKSPISRMSLKGFLYYVESSVVLLYKDIIMSPPLNPNTIHTFKTSMWTTFYTFNHKHYYTII